MVFWVLEKEAAREEGIGLLVVRKGWDLNARITDRW